MNLPVAIEAIARRTRGSGSPTAVSSSAWLEEILFTGVLQFILNLPVYLQGSRSSIRSYA